MWVGKIENAILRLQAIILNAEVAAATRDPAERRSYALRFYRQAYLEDRQTMSPDEEAAFEAWLMETFRPMPPASRE
ncbi:hypothetical protein ACH0BU_11815 [Sphingomonas olei]